MHQSKPQKALGKKSAPASSGIVRIIGGTMRGRKLRFHTVDGLRPTLDRVRETLFNWLARDIAGSRCLDLFAGSGALGFEAASRGAKSITLVERSAKVARDLKNNCQLLSADNIHVINQEAARFLTTNEEKFDLIFLDPPFGQGLLNRLFDDLLPHLNANALVYIEQEKNEQTFVPNSNWTQLKFKTTGSFSYALYQLTDATSG